MYFPSSSSSRTMARLTSFWKNRRADRLWEQNMLEHCKVASSDGFERERYHLIPSTALAMPCFFFSPLTTLKAFFNYDAIVNLLQHGIAYSVFFIYCFVLKRDNF
jgi:hypothetical protein